MKFNNKITVGVAAFCLSTGTLLSCSLALAQQKPQTLASDSVPQKTIALPASALSQAADSLQQAAPLTPTGEDDPSLALNTGGDDKPVPPTDDMNDGISVNGDVNVQTYGTNTTLAPSDQKRVDQMRESINGQLRDLLNDIDISKLTLPQVITQLTEIRETAKGHKEELWALIAINRALVIEGIFSESVSSQLRDEFKILRAGISLALDYSTKEKYEEIVSDNPPVRDFTLSSMKAYVPFASKTISLSVQYKVLLKNLGYVYWDMWYLDPKNREDFKEFYKRISKELAKLPKTNTDDALWYQLVTAANTYCKEVRHSLKEWTSPPTPMIKPIKSGSIDLHPNGVGVDFVPQKIVIEQKQPEKVFVDREHARYHCNNGASDGPWLVEIELHWDQKDDCRFIATLLVNGTSRLQMTDAWDFKAGGRNYYVKSDMYKEVLTFRLETSNPADLLNNTKITVITVRVDSEDKLLGQFACSRVS